MKYSYVPIIIIVFGFIFAEIILFLGGTLNMDIAGWISIAVALIAVAGGIWAQVVQFKKDGQRIDGVRQTAGKVKADTSEMKPKINTIEEVTKQISNDIVRNILPQMNQVEKIEENVGTLLEGYNFDKEIKKRISPELNSPDYLVNSIQLLYEKNAACNYQIQQLTEEKIILQAENLELQQEVMQLKEEKEQLKNENSDLNKRLSHMERARTERSWDGMER